MSTHCATDFSNDFCGCVNGGSTVTELKNTGQGLNAKTKERGCCKVESAFTLLETRGSRRHPKVRGADCHKPFAKITGLPLPWGKTCGKVEGTVLPHLLINDVDNVQIMDFQGGIECIYYYLATFCLILYL